MNDVGGGGGQIKCGKIGRTKMTQSHSLQEGRKEGRKEGRISYCFSLSPFYAQIFVASGKSHLKFGCMRMAGAERVGSAVSASGLLLLLHYPPVRNFVRGFLSSNKAPSVVRNAENTQEIHPSLPFQAPNWKGYSHSPSLFTDVNSRLSEPLSLSLSLRRPRRESTLRRRRGGGGDLNIHTVFLPYSGSLSSSFLSVGALCSQFSFV